MLTDNNKKRKSIKPTKTNAVMKQAVPSYGGGAVDVEMIDVIRELIDSGDVILELGSGHGSTHVLSKEYTLYSIEHDERFVGLYDSHYIHAPLVNDFWYDRSIVEKNIPDNYSLLLVDGPIAHRRKGFIDNYDLFDQHVPIILDDMQRKVEQQMCDELIKKHNKKVITDITTSTNKRFVVLVDNE